MFLRPGSHKPGQTVLTGDMDTDTDSLHKILLQHRGEQTSSPIPELIGANGSNTAVSGIHLPPHESHSVVSGVPLDPHNSHVMPCDPFNKDLVYALRCWLDRKHLYQRMPFMVPTTMVITITMDESMEE